MPTWLIILIIFIAAFGPIAYFFPSRRDRQLTALRARARQEGLSVDIRPLERLDAPAAERVSAGGRVREARRLVPRYAAVLPRRLRTLSSWRIQPGPSNRAAVEVAPGWFFDPTAKFPPVEGWPDSLRAVQANLAMLPDGVRGVELDNHEIAIYWTEKAVAVPDNVSELAAILRQMAETLVELDENRRRLDDSGDP